VKQGRDRKLAAFAKETQTTRAAIELRWHYKDGFMDIKPGISHLNCAGIKSLQMKENSTHQKHDQM
jgi:hypothetical protein